MKNKKNHSQEWIDDCLRFHGIVLDGDFVHWCSEWDDLPIDETLPEFEFCICYTQEEKNKILLQNKSIDQLSDDELENYLKDLNETDDSGNSDVF